jgi:hypothetical protein
MLGVPAGLLESVGAVSEAVARAMAQGALRGSGAELALSCTGIAGPGGATPGKPVGLVFIGAAKRSGTRVLRRVFPGDRSAERAATVAEALALARDGHMTVDAALVTLDFALRHHLLPADEAHVASAALAGLLAQGTVEPLPGSFHRL